MIKFLNLIKDKRRGLSSLFLSVLTVGMISCNSEEISRMPDFHKKGTLYPIEINMTGNVSKSTLRSFASNNGKFDIGYDNESDIFIAYQNEENIPCILIFRNSTNSSQTFVAKGNAKITTNRPQGAVPSRNDMADIKLQVSADANYKIDGNWEVKPIIGVTEKSGKFSFPTEFKTTNKKVKCLPIPITSDWMRLEASKINSGKFVDINNVNFLPDGVVLNISVQSEFCDPVGISQIIFTENSKIGHSSPYDISGKPQSGYSIYISEELGADGERLYGKLSDYTDKVNQIMVWANIINGNTNNIQSYFEFYPVCRDPFVDRSKKYKRVFVTPYDYLNWAANPENADNITSGKAYSMNMKARSLDIPMITEVYLNGEYSMVEIYNPTNRDINLSDYFLVKTSGNGSFAISNSRELYTLDGYPYGSQGTLGLPLYVGPQHNNGTINLYERQTTGSQLVIFGDDETNILCNYNTPIMASSDQTVLKAGKTMVICGPGYLKADGSFDTDKYQQNAPVSDIAKSKDKSNIQILVAVDNSGFSSSNNRNSSNKDIMATLNLNNEEGLAIIKKLNNGDAIRMNRGNDTDKYMVVDVFPYDRSRAGLQAPFHMCRYDGIVFPYNRSAELEDHDYGEGVKREGLNKQWYLDEIGGTEEIHSFGSRYRSW